MNGYIISWILEFLTNRTQFVKIHNNRSSICITNTGAPQGCVISPALFTLYTNDCRSTVENIPLIKFADDSTLQGLISNMDDGPYLSAVDNFVSWCEDNFLCLNVSKTKELIIDFRRKKHVIDPITIKGETIEQVDSYKYLGITIDSKLQWGEHISNTLKKVNKRLYFVRKLGQLKVDKKLITLFYGSIIESVISFCITVWGSGLLDKDRESLDNVIKKAGRHTNKLSSVDNLIEKFCLNKIFKILNDSSHALSHCITPSGRSNRLLSIITKSKRHNMSFLPYTIRLYNSNIK